MQREVTILIPVRNGDAFIAAAVESVLKQTFTAWELIVSDNGSTDGTRSVVEQYLSDARITLLTNEQNAGMTGNFNKCLDQVRTKYYMLLCHDDFLYVPHALQTAHRIMEENPEIPAAYSDLMFVDAAARPVLRRSYGRAGYIDSERLARQSILQTRNLFGIPIMVRTAAIAGLRYDPALSFTLDLDLSIAMSRGGHIYHIPETLIGNRYHGSNQTGMLLPRLLSEMHHIARKNGFALGRHHRALMRVSHYSTCLARSAFMWYLQRTAPAKCNAMTS